MKNQTERPSTRATELLQEQHREIDHLFKRLTSASNGHRAEVLDALIALLQLHTRLEETFFYPAIQRLDTKKAEEVVLESYEEHAIVDFVMAQLPTMDLHSERFLARARVLQSLVEEHVQEEEGELFRLAEKLGDDGLASLGERMAQEIEEVEHLRAVLDRAARAARNTERWAGAMIDVGLAVPRRVVSALLPSRLLGMSQPQTMVERVANTMPHFLVEGLYRTMVAPPRESSRSAA